MARWNKAGEIVEQDDLLLTKGAGRSPATNFAMCLNNRQGRSGTDLFDHIQSFYRERKTGFSIHIRKHADAALELICMQEKMLLISDAPGMMMDKPLPGKKMPDGVEIRPATEISAIADFISVTIQSYQSLGMRPEVGAKIFATPGRLLKPCNHMIVAYDRGQPVSAAMLIFSNSIAGIYWVRRPYPGARGKGLAETCVRSVTNEAFQRGAPFVVLPGEQIRRAGLQADGFYGVHELSVVYVFC